MKRVALLATMLLFAACAKKDSVTGPSSAEAWASGEWVATSMSGAPLPYRNAQTFPYLTYDSLDVFVNIIGDSPPSASVFPYSTLHFANGTTPTPILCSEALGPVTITSSTVVTGASGTVTNGGGCNPSLVTFDFTRSGNTLVGTWAGVSVVLIKR